MQRYTRNDGLLNVPLLAESRPVVASAFDPKRTFAMKFLKVKSSLD